MNRKALLWEDFPYQDVLLWFDEDGRLKNWATWQGFMGG
jgi:hypothetical protein